MKDEALNVVHAKADELKQMVDDHLDDTSNLIKQKTLESLAGERDKLMDVLDAT